MDATRETLEYFVERAHVLRDSRFAKFIQENGLKFTVHFGQASSASRCPNVSTGM
jgi:hypothetical protein